MNVYPPDWPEIARTVKQEAGWRCVRCGHPDDPDRCADLNVNRGRQPCDDRCTHPKGDGKQRVLTVHHLDGNKANCEWWNLPALCQACHLAIQGKVKMEQTYMLPHSPWFLPYVAGFYAYRLWGVHLLPWEAEDRAEGVILQAQQTLLTMERPV